jgi:Tetratricopeptide Repeats-Sensor
VFGTAFIVRPFKAVDGIDFDAVERELIEPVLRDAQIKGRTTQEIARAGNIRTDMFERLLLADLVIADISIHNANVYYELGIRHALRPRTTILIRARKDEVPFDLKTDRYLEYSPDDPGGARELLAEAVRQSASFETKDSPVYLMLPGLKPTDPEEFRPMPEDFTEDVREAVRRQDLPLLAVLGEEAAMFDWALAGARVVGRAQFDLSAWPDARATWEEVRKERPDDSEANLLLGTIYQRLGDPVASTSAVERTLNRRDVPARQQAEALALKARNLKDRWVGEWGGKPTKERPAAALRSPFLEQARRAYGEAFLADQNHWYSGINALALAVVTVRLAEQHGDVWGGRFESQDKEAAALDELRSDIQEMTFAVRRSLAADDFQRSLRGEGNDVWADLTRADLALLTVDQPQYVAARYAEARARMAESGGKFPAEAASRQIRFYLRLGLFSESGKAALEALGASEEEKPPTPPQRQRIIVFAGHRIDAPDRPQPRFPATSEGKAGTMIRAALEDELRLADDDPTEGIAGGASGGDILFHELCRDLGIPTRLLLALPKDPFAVASVQDAGPDWMERYRALCAQLDPTVLATDERMPRWLALREDEYGIWQRNNLWMLHNALSRADADVTLIVLWDGKGGDGPGGTADMVRLAESRGLRVVRLDATRLV